ncbi:MAG TPA: DUF6600 domain-containing protein [Chthoniobacterales bacterium]
MKKFSVFPLIAALAFSVSCQKQQTEEERKAEVERQVQDRLAAERVEAEKNRLAQDQAALADREKALSDREAAAAITPAEEPATTPSTVVAEQPESRTEARSTAAYGMFYQKLDQYGDWRETAEYGYVWQPREAEESRDWRPYTEGRWVYSDAGWTFISDEPFGWATYHYGRWLRLRRVGWVWVPGNEWAPAWVSWRTNKDYVGWAPLPPEARFDRRTGIQNWADNYYDIGPDQYSFVPSNEFGAQKIRSAVVPAERNVSIVFETTNVTRITYANNFVVNEGPSYDELRSRSQRPIERYRLRRQNSETVATVRGDELEISAPTITEVRDMPRPRRIKERVVEVNIDNGWTIADRSAAERARNKIRTESTPPPNAPPKTFVKPAESSVTSSATPAAATSTTPAAASSSTPATPAATAKTSPSPSSSQAPTATPVASATPRTRPSTTATPGATAAAAPSATPAASPTTRPGFTPSTPSAASATSIPATTITPTASASVRARPSPPTRSLPTPSMAPSVSATATATPAQSIPARDATTTPATSISPAARTRPSPTQPRITRPLPVNTPPSTETPPTKTESIATPLPTSTPVKRVTPPARTALPTPSATAAETTEAARSPVPRDIPRRTMPPRPAPSPAATAPAAGPSPSLPPSSPAAADERGKNRRPKSAAPNETPTPTPSTTPH